MEMSANRLREAMRNADVEAVRVSSSKSAVR